MSCASLTPSGASRTATSSMASAKTPPTPTITAGPNCGSRITPAMSSRFPDTMGAIRIDTSPSSGRAAASSSLAAVYTAAVSARPRRTRPRSVLWAMVSPHSFAATGKPRRCAATTAASGSSTVSSVANGTPKGANKAFESISDNVEVAPVAGKVAKAASVSWVGREEGADTARNSTAQPDRVRP